jgi:RHS repeat-associated protein
VYRYDAWGAFQGTAAPAAGEASLAYAGQHWDGDAGLSYAQQRWYDPRTGRFLSEDPVCGDLANPNSLMAFGYGNGNPLLYADPTGEKSVRQLLEEAAARNRATSEGWMTFYNVLHAGWDSLDAISFGTIKKLDTIEDRVEAGDKRYKGYCGASNYASDVIGTSSAGVRKMATVAKVAQGLAGAGGWACACARGRGPSP